MENIAIGPFVYYSLGIGVLILGITFFVNLVRGIVLTSLGIGLAYYMLVASPDMKIDMDNYMKNLYTSIKGGNIISSSSSLVNGIVNNVKTEVSKKVTEFSK
jgi:hypothetical protein